MIRVALLVGSIPGARCGVADYTAHLSQALACAGISVSLFRTQRWSLAGLRETLAEAARSDCELVHVQYPAFGYGWSLTPHLLGYVSRCPSIVTLHEYRLVHPLRKITMGAFSGGFHHIVFTSAAEQSAFTRIFPWSQSHSSVIPIGSNIPFVQAPGKRDNNVVVYFGRLRPHHGLEQFMELARIAAARGRPYRFRVIGARVPGHTAYIESLQARAAGGLEWALDLGEQAVAQELAQSMAAYLPYIDGASPRHGSLWAALGNGLAVVTSPGPSCPLGLETAVRFACSPAQALDELDLITGDAELCAELRAVAMEYVKQYSWKHIAELHSALYRAVMERARPCHFLPTHNIK